MSHSLTSEEEFGEDRLLGGVGTGCKHHLSGRGKALGKRSVSKTQWPHLLTDHSKYISEMGLSDCWSLK